MPERTYGPMAFVVAQQARSIGLRMALGAAKVQILQSVLRESSSRVAAGLSVGLAAAWGISQMFSVGSCEDFLWRADLKVVPSI